MWSRDLRGMALGLGLAGAAIVLGSMHETGAQAVWSLLWGGFGVWYGLEWYARNRARR